MKDESNQNEQSEACRPFSLAPSDNAIVIGVPALFVKVARMQAVVADKDFRRWLRKSNTHLHDAILDVEFAVPKLSLPGQVTMAAYPWNDKIVMRTP